MIMNNSLWTGVLDIYYYILNIIKIYFSSIPCLLSQGFCKLKQPRGIDDQVGGERVAIVTGGAKGIGFEISRHLAKIGLHVIMGVRENSLGIEAIHKIKTEFPKAKVEAEVMDLRSMKSVRHFVNNFKSRNLPLHILINNAGVMLVPRTITEDGYEEHFQVNYLGHFLLTRLLLEKLKESGSVNRHSRIVNMSSYVHYVASIDMNAINGRRIFSPHGAYTQSKLALHLFTRCLQRHLLLDMAPVMVNSVHPGVVDTDLFEHVNKLVKFLSIPLKPVYKTARQGALTPLYVALSPVLEGCGGRYYDNCEEITSSNTSDCHLLQDQLWHLTDKMCGLNNTQNLCRPIHK